MKKTIPFAVIETVPVNDAVSIKETLMANCLFEEGNIHMICNNKSQKFNLV